MIFKSLPPYRRSFLLSCFLELVLANGHFLKIGMMWFLLFYLSTYQVASVCVFFVQIMPHEVLIRSRELYIKTVLLTSKVSPVTLLSQVSDSLSPLLTISLV